MKLVTILNQILKSVNPSTDHIVITNRRPNVFTTTFNSEIVACKLGDGSELKLFCKYNRGDFVFLKVKSQINYEAKVYKNILSQNFISTPQFYGAHKDKRSGCILLVFEYLENCICLDNLPGNYNYVPAIISAARAIGRFHMLSQSLMSQTNVAFLKTYDLTYYLQSIEKSLSLSKKFYRDLPWLTMLGEKAPKIFYEFAKQKPVIIHGDYHPKNIFFRRGKTFPVDWGSAAIAVSEIDLAGLTSGWPARVVKKCEKEYQEARWGQNPPRNFKRIVTIANLYEHFRCLGYKQSYAVNQKETLSWRFNELCSLGKQLGLL